MDVLENTSCEVDRSIEKTFKCIVCRKFQTEGGSMLLPCLHHVCAGECCDLLLSGTEPDSVHGKCPSCCIKLDVSNLVSVNVKAEHSKLKSSTKKMNCTYCDRNENTAEKFCPSCDDFLCKACADNHGVMLLTKSHELLEVEAGLNTLSSKHKLNMEVVKCLTHRNELSLFCVTCDTQICTDCAVDEAHKGHEFTDTAELVTELRAMLSQGVTQFEPYKDLWLQAYDELTTKAINGIDEQKRVLIAKIRGQLMRAIIPFLKRELEVRKEMVRVTVLKKKELNWKRAWVKALGSQVEQYVQSVPQYLEFSDTDLFAKRESLIRQFRYLQKQTAMLLDNENYKLFVEGGWFFHTVTPDEVAMQALEACTQSVGRMVYTNGATIQEELGAIIGNEAEPPELGPLQEILLGLRKNQMAAAEEESGGSSSPETMDMDVDGVPVEATTEESTVAVDPEALEPEPGVEVEDEEAMDFALEETQLVVVPGSGLEDSDGEDEVSNNVAVVTEIPTPKPTNSNSSVAGTSMPKLTADGVAGTSSARPTTSMVAPKSMPKLTANPVAAKSKPKPTESVDGERKTEKNLTVKPKLVEPPKKRASSVSDRETPATKDKAKNEDRPVSHADETLRANSEVASTSTSRPRSTSESPRRTSRSSDLSPVREPRMKRNSRGRTPKNLESYSLSSNQGGSDEDEASTSTKAKTRTLRKRGGKKNDGNQNPGPSSAEPVAVKKPRQIQSRRKSGMSGGENSVSEKSDDENGGRSETSLTTPVPAKLQNVKIGQTPKSSPTPSSAKKTPKKKPGPAPGSKPRGRKKAPEPPNFYTELLTFPLIVNQKMKITLDDPNEDYCTICMDGGDSMICCDYCPKVFHLRCHLPVITSIPDDDDFDWQCLFCMKKEDVAKISADLIQLMVFPENEGISHKELIHACKFVTEVHKCEGSQFVGVKYGDYFEDSNGYDPEHLHSIRLRLTQNDPEPFTSIEDLLLTMRKMMYQANAFYDGVDFPGIVETWEEFKKAYYAVLTIYYPEAVGVDYVPDPAQPAIKHYTF